MDITAASTTDESPIDMSYLLERVRELKQEKAQRDANRFEALCKAISKKKDEAVKYRKSSGIETVWQEDQDYYEGVDQFNRTRIRYNKPYASDAPLTEQVPQNTTQCTEFVNITRQFVDSAEARCGDILLPRGDWNWGAKKTPIGDDAQTKTQGAQTPQDEAQQADIALRNAKGEQRIKDWLVETKYEKAYRKALSSAARIGTGILKGPFPKIYKTKSVDQEGELVISEKIGPATEFVEPEDFFPDPNCGDDIHKGQFVFERGLLSYKELEDLKRMGGEYIAEAIDKVLQEGPAKSYLDQKLEKGENDLFEVWYFTGLIDMNDMDLLDERFGQEISIQEDEGEVKICGCDEPGERGKDFQSIQAVMVNDTIIKGNMNPLQDGGFPYDVLCWQKQKGHWAGIGVARQMRVAQKIMLDMGRSLMDNMALSAIPMIAMKQGAIVPENGIMELAKGKLWYLTEDQVATIQEAIQFLTVPSMQKEIMEIMLLAGKMAEDATGVNALLQGEQGQATETVGGMNMLHKNASALLRRVARICDDDVTEPHVTRYYDWLLMYGEADEKGDLKVEATGSSVLVERELEAMQAQILLQFSADPEYGINKSAIMRRITKGWGFEPTEIFYSEEEMQKRAEAAAQQPQPQDPRIQAAQIQAEVTKYVAELRAQVDQLRVQKDTDRDAVYSAGVSERNHMTYQAQVEKLQLQERLALMEYVNTEKITLAEAKVQLAEAAMKINATKELAGMEASASRLPTPPVEPPGKAQPGRSFTQ